MSLWAAAAEHHFRPGVGAVWWTMPMNSCRRCGGEVVRKGRWRLALVGAFMLAAVGLGSLWSPLSAPAVILGLTGAYLLAWASVGRGRWCRGCKRFDGV
jgi:hypothetical protein